MGGNVENSRWKTDWERVFSPNVKYSQKRPRKKPQYERFGEIIRYIRVEELQQFFDVIQNSRHKIMFELIYQSGCRIGEFVRIQLKHLAFERNSVYFPAENTKTGQRRVSHLPAGLMNEIISLLRQEGRMAKRSLRLSRPSDYLFYPRSNPKMHYTENRLRQIFARYRNVAGLGREYKKDRIGRSLNEISCHSLRHSHIMHYVHNFKVPLSIVQKQVGHQSLKTTGIYLQASEEEVGGVYAEARAKIPFEQSHRKLYKR